MRVATRGEIVTVRINCWSGPRNVSTALMYSFRQRADTTVYDEPLYAHYLRVTGRVHPGRDDVLAAQDDDGAAVVRDVILADQPTPVAFFKQMAHHLVDLDDAVLGECRNILLTRDPRNMLPSLAVQLPDAGIPDTGLDVQVRLLDQIIGAGDTPIVIDSRALLDDPANVLAAVCERLGIGRDDAMLSWPAGPKTEDGVWAPHWYDNVHRTTGFLPYAATTRALPDALRPVLDEAIPLYDRLAAYAVD